MKKEAAKTTPAIVVPPKDIKMGNQALLDRIQELTAETLAHPQVVNKSDEGIASRVARVLNKEGVFKCTGHRFWTGAHVQMVSIPIKK